MLESPPFLYRVELPPAGAAPARSRRSGPTSSPRGCRTSSSTRCPTTALFSAAAAGRLATPADLEREARRLLQDPRARDAAAGFFGQWLLLAKLDDQKKDAKLYPEFNDALRAAMREETLRFTTATLLDGDGRFETLLTSTHAMVNAPLAKLYGVAAPAGTGFAPVDLDPGATQRPAHAGGHPDADRRGRQHLARAPRQVRAGPAAVPAAAAAAAQRRHDVPDARARPDAARALRDAHDERRRARPATPSSIRSASASSTTTPSAAGATWTAARPSTPRGEIKGTRDINGPFNGAIELGRKLVGSQQARACMAKQWFSFAQGRPDEDGDQVSMRAAIDAFEGSDANLRELVVALVKSDAFRTRLVDPVTP